MVICDHGPGCEPPGVFVVAFIRLSAGVCSRLLIFGELSFLSLNWRRRLLKLRNALTLCNLWAFGWYWLLVWPGLYGRVLGCLVS